MLESRSATPHPLGKLDRNIDIPICEETEERLVALYRLKGFKSKTEYARFLIERALYGEFSMVEMMTNMDRKEHPTNIG